jgi:trans-aconitate 2-methyltransferase
MPDWDAARYRRFEDDRTRPSRELLARVPLAEAKLAYDLGCGPGNSTELIIERFPQARVIGIVSPARVLRKVSFRCGRRRRSRTSSSPMRFSNGCRIIPPR